MSDFGDPTPIAEELIRLLTARGKMIALAESCTAGLAADMIARFPGASKVLWGSFVTYTADAKTRMLGVPKELIEAHGAVSRPVALAMAEGALERSGASWAVSITGLAGPGGEGAEGAPVGTVWIGLAGIAGAGARPEAKRFLFEGSRNEVRAAAATAALKKLLERILTAEEILF
ncbi:MAG: CinA family protein [Treponema sp.]|jgi:PncC family amidohydrolase|nr:CinA family protein [Treponema sp.]